MQDQNTTRATFAFELARTFLFDRTMLVLTRGGELKATSIRTTPRCNILATVPALEGGAA